MDLLEKIIDDNIENIPAEHSQNALQYSKHLAQRPHQGYRKFGGYIWAFTRKTGLGAAAGTLVGYLAGDVMLGAQTGAIASGVIAGLDMVLDTLRTLSRDWQKTPKETRLQRRHLGQIGFYFQHTIEPVSTTAKNSLMYAMIFGLAGGLSTGEWLLSAGVGATYGVVDSFRMIVKGHRMEKNMIEYNKKLPSHTPDLDRGPSGTPM